MLEEDAKKSLFTDEQLEQMSQKELIEEWKKMELYANSLEINLKECESKLKTKTHELNKLKNVILMNYVSTKELESTVKFLNRLFI
jgi:hypothetical protein